MKNLWKEKVDRGEKTMGFFICTGNASTAEIAGISEMDYALIDTEHGLFDVESAASMIRAIKLHGGTPLVRVKDPNRSSILKMLDVGAEGIVIPCVKNMEEIGQIVSYGKYAPIGERGYATARASDYGYAEHCRHGVDHYMAHCNRNCLLIPQCETRGALEHIEEITHTEGIDGIFIGPFDLSIAMGIPLQFDSKEFKDALQRILKACRDAGKICIAFCADTAVAKARLSEGFEHLCVANGYNYYHDALNNAYREVMG